MLASRRRKVTATRGLDASPVTLARDPRGLQPPRRTARRTTPGFLWISAGAPPSLVNKTGARNSKVCSFRAPQSKGQNPSWSRKAGSARFLLLPERRVTACAGFPPTPLRPPGVRQLRRLPVCPPVTCLLSYLILAAVLYPAGPSVPRTSPLPAPSSQVTTSPVESVTPNQEIRGSGGSRGPPTMWASSRHHVL